MGVSLNEWKQEIWVLKTIKKEEMVLDVTFVGSRCPDGNFPSNREKEVK